MKQFKKWTCVTHTAAAVSLMLVSVMAAAAAETDVSVSAEAGYRLDELNWNIAGWNADPGDPDQQRSGEYVNILSELTWSDVKIAQLGVAFEAQEQRVYLKGRFAYGEVLDGDNQDSDYDYDNRQGEFSRSNNGVFGDTLDATISLGYRFDVAWGERPLHIMPLIGGAIHEQNFGMDDGYQALYVPYAENSGHPQAGVPDPTAVGSAQLAGLNSSYDTEWQTSWLGLDVWRTVTPKLMLKLNLEYHNGDYSAVANWNLRQDLAHPRSFAHWADGEGVVVAGGGRYALSRHTYLSFGVRYGDWTTDPGVDRVYFNSGAITDTPLNEVNWQSLAVNLGLGMRL